MGNVKADADKRTSVPKVFTAGDMTRGQSLIVWAIAEGRHAARSIDEFLDGLVRPAQAPRARQQPAAVCLTHRSMAKAARKVRESMTINQFSQAIRHQPFRPFQLILVDGRTFTVDHPEFAAIDFEADDPGYVLYRRRILPRVDRRLMAGIVVPPESRSPSAAERKTDDPARSVARFADALKRHPAKRIPKEGNRLRLYMMDLVEGGTSLIADEPEPGFNWIATPKWSHDGTRIVFGTWPLPGFEMPCQGDRASAMDPDCVSISARAIDPLFLPMTSGSCLRSNAGGAGSRAGVWVMEADGSVRRRMGEYAGAPFWSPDGRSFLLCDYSDRSIVVNLETKRAGRTTRRAYRPGSQRNLS